MDFSTLIQVINSGIPAGIAARLASEAIIRLIDKVKAKFNGKAVTEERLKQLMNENVDLKETLEELQNELTKENIIVNCAGKIEIKNQINNSTLYNPNFY